MKTMKRTSGLPALLTLMYCIGLCGAWALLYGAADRWWPVSLLLFGPRWMLGLPLLVLLPWAVLRHRLLLIPLGFAAVVLAGPVMGFQVAQEQNGVPSGARIRVLSCNLRVGEADFEALSRVVREYDVDVVAVQEYIGDRRLTLPEGWQGKRDGQVAVYSRFPLQVGEALKLHRGGRKWKRQTVLPAVIRTPAGPVAFFAVHLPSARYGLQHLLDRRKLINPEKAGLLEAETRAREEASMLARAMVDRAVLPVIVAGDFNLPRESYIFRRYWSDMSDASVLLTGYGWTFFESLRGLPVMLAVDRVLAGNGAEARWFRVGPDVDSDHRPVIADVVLTPAG